MLLQKDINVTIKQIANGMLSLKNDFSAKRYKEEAAPKKSGSGRKDLYISRWQFYRRF